MRQTVILNQGHSGDNTVALHSGSISLQNLYKESHSVLFPFETVEVMKVLKTEA